MITDAHVHLPVFEGCTTLEEKRIRLLRDMEENGIDACAVISDSYTESSIGNPEEVINLFAKDDNVAVICGISPFVEYKARLEQIGRYISEGLCAGIKLFTGHEEFFLSDNVLAPVFDLAEKYDVPVLFHSGWDNPKYGSAEEAEIAAERYGSVKLVCCHMFYPDIENCLRLINYGNVYFDMSSVADDENIIGDIRAKLKQVINAGGKLVFGSDYSGCSQRSHLELVKSLCLGKDEADRILYKNAAELYFRRR